MNTLKNRFQAFILVEIIILYLAVYTLFGTLTILKIEQELAQLLSYMSH
ncbi:hypothetical protein KKC97_03060 [bacterium]|nr:hypothetical protein [bacterium]MBU1636624.1 hypothetical protein [bacterium]MBU1919806.1 hypothetical protein [bacterium]